LAIGQLQLHHWPQAKNMKLGFGELPITGGNPTGTYFLGFCVMCYIKIEIHGQGFDCIWQVRFKLSTVAQAQFNTRMTEIPQLLDVVLYDNI
jgi:hypothetical protein